MKRIHFELIAPALWTLMVARVETVVRPARDWLPVTQSPDPPKKPAQDPPDKPSQDPPITPSQDPPDTESPVREPEPTPVREAPPFPVKEPDPSPVPEAPPSPVPPSPPFPVRQVPPSTVPDVMDEPGVNIPDIETLEEQLRATLALSQTVNALSRRVPWPSACMDRALALHRLMEKRGLPHTLYMGVKKNDKQRLEAHAWITAGGKVITGGPVHRAYRPVAVYHF